MQASATVKVCKTGAKYNFELFFLGCKKIDYCLNTTCKTGILSVCLECVAFHPVWNIPVLHRNRKCTER